MLPSEDLCSNTKPTGEYGSVAVTPAADPSPTDDDSDSDDSIYSKAKESNKVVNERLQKDGNWLTYLRGFAVFIPMIWPVNQPRLYLNMLGCGLCILCTRALNVLQPNQLRVIVNILTSGSGSLYKAIGLYIFFGWASSSAGIGLIQECLWQPIETYSEVQLDTAAYNQVMELSCDFHDNKQSGELYQSIRQGSSVNHLLRMLIFQFGPRILDIIVGYGFLYHLFGPYMAFIAAATTISYLSTVFYFNTKQSRSRREFQALARKASQVMYDTVGSWTTVSYFNRIPYEKERYGRAQRLSTAAYQSYFLLQNLYFSIGDWMLELGLLGALLLAAYQVSHGARTVGDFTALLSYWPIFASCVLHYLINVPS